MNMVCVGEEGDWLVELGRVGGAVGLVGKVR